MKNTRLLILALVTISFVVTLVSCDKGGDDPTPAPPVVTKTMLLTKSVWKVKTTGIDVDKNGTIDGFPLITKDCALDNSYTFNSNGTGVINEEALKCDAADPQTSPFAWVLKSGETVINGDFKVAGWTGDGTISALNDTSFVFYKDTLIAPFGSVRAVVSLKH